MGKITFTFLVIALLASSAFAGKYDYLDEPVARYESEDEDYEASTYQDPYGYTTGTADEKEVNLYTDEFGYTHGTIGDKDVYCYTDPYGYTTCN
jgi:hypothetical protein